MTQAPDVSADVDLDRPQWVKSIPFLLVHARRAGRPVPRPAHLAAGRTRTGGLLGLHVRHHRRLPPLLLPPRLPDRPGLPVRPRPARHALGPEGRPLVGRPPPGPPPLLRRGEGRPQPGPAGLLVEPRRLDPLGPLRPDPRRPGEGPGPLPGAGLPRSVRRCWCPWRSPWPSSPRAVCPALLWGFFVPVVVAWHVTFSINSVAHVLGSRRYPTGDDSRNNPVLALLTFGEGWHNNHHFYATTANQGWFWWELDITYLALRVLSATGLVWDLRTPPPHVRAGRLPAPVGPTGRRSGGRRGRRRACAVARRAPALPAAATATASSARSGGGGATGWPNRIDHRDGQREPGEQPGQRQRRGQREQGQVERLGQPPAPVEGRRRLLASHDGAGDDGRAGQRGDAGEAAPAEAGHPVAVRPGARAPREVPPGRGRCSSRGRGARAPRRRAAAPRPSGPGTGRSGGPARARGSSSGRSSRGVTCRASVARSTAASQWTVPAVVRHQHEGLLGQEIGAVDVDAPPGAEEEVEDGACPDQQVGVHAVLVEPGREIRAGWRATPAARARRAGPGRKRTSSSRELLGVGGGAGRAGHLGEPGLAVARGGSGGASPRAAAGVRGDGPRRRRRGHGVGRDRALRRAPLERIVSEDRTPGLGCAGGLPLPR